MVCVKVLLGYEETASERNERHRVHILDMQSPSAEHQRASSEGQ
jgi:hypothetical protein